jgi:hypothetical protein
MLDLNGRHVRYAETGGPGPTILFCHQTEVGDACEFYSTAFFQDQETAPSFDAWVQRTWSNASGGAGHDPCVPAPTDPYFNLTPLDLQDVTVTVPQQLNSLLPGVVPATKGFKATAGSSITFAVGLYSDAATSGPWSLSVAPGNPLLGSKNPLNQYNPSTITATIDMTSGTNGQKAYVTVNVQRRERCSRARSLRLRRR